MREKSRLSRKEEIRSLKKALFYGSLTFVLALILIFLGIPILIRLSIFLGNLRSSSLPVETQDTLPPSPPTFKAIPEATNSAQLDLYGFAEPGSKVKIFLLGSEEKEVVVDQDGSFILTKLELTAGTNQIYAVATDEVGNTSQESDKLVIFYKQSPPELEILQPTENQTFAGGQDKVEVKGKTEADTTVYINEHLVIVDREGIFSYSIPLKEGENLIEVVVTDLAGNETKKEIAVSYSP